MYANVDEAREALDEAFFPATVSTVLAALVPTIGFALAGEQNIPRSGPHASAAHQTCPRTPPGRYAPFRRTSRPLPAAAPASCPER